MRGPREPPPTPHRHLNIATWRVGEEWRRSRRERQEILWQLSTLQVDIIVLLDVTFENRAEQRHVERQWAKWGLAKWSYAAQPISPNENITTAAAAPQTHGGERRRTERTEQATERTETRRGEAAAATARPNGDGGGQRRPALARVVLDEYREGIEDDLLQTYLKEEKRQERLRQWRQRRQLGYQEADEAEQEAAATMAEQEEGGRERDPRKRFVVRMRYRGNDEKVLTREFLVGTFLLQQLEMEAKDFLVVIIPWGSREVDVHLSSEATYRKFWVRCREWNHQELNSMLRYFDLVPLFQGDARVITVSFRGMEIPKEDIDHWLRNHCKVLLPPQKKRDKFGIWNGEYKAIVMLHPKKGETEEDEESQQRRQWRELRAELRAFVVQTVSLLTCLSSLGLQGSSPTPWAQPYTNRSGPLNRTKRALCYTQKSFTQRGVLSTVNSIYDLLGFAAPVVIQGKCLLREFTQDIKDWDQPLSDLEKSRWENWKSALTALKPYQGDMYLSHPAQENMYSFTYFPMLQLKP
ncbi:zinc finger CCHC domain-containing protein 3 [Sphaerodactylus townsendi]|uniref:zinc finger CCHC domain-containing protein 3 n=1 Tax=Sphaerodactylus townsendi TaxID=933632 RepID=UPI0020265729|nr:zinc finger CCHC domain-containing protein 3 [Sphaerodactylus townsendi]